MRTEIKTTTVNAADVVAKTKHETLSSGQTIPIYEPCLKSEKIKARKYNTAIGKYKTLKNISEVLNKGYKIVGFENIKNGGTEEEKLISVSNELLILEAPDKTQTHRIVPKKRSTAYKQFHSDSLNKGFHFKCVSDECGVLALSFEYHKLESEIVVMELKLSFVYIDKSSLKITQHQQELSMDFKGDLKFDTMLCSGVLCVVWKTYNQCSRWNFNHNNSTDVSYLKFDVKENLMDVYAISLDEDFLKVVAKDEDFYDDVFSTVNASKRLAVHYSHQTGVRIDTKQAITDALRQDSMNYPSDVVFVNMPLNPTWMVFEWLLPEMTLSSVYFYKLQDGHLKKDGVLNFQDIFSEYKTYFGRLNELQSKITVSRDPWRVYFWTSKNYALIVDPVSYKITTILKMNLFSYNDFKNEIYDFEFDISKNNSGDVTVYVSRYNEIVHFSKFLIAPVTSTPTTSSQEENVDTSVQRIISILKIDLNNTQVLDAIP